MAPPKASIDDLRAIFREEFDDLVHVLSRQADRAERATSSADVAAAAAEVRRAVHTLKGAARAVGFSDLEKECHRLENRIEALRARGEVPARDVVASAREALTALHRFADVVRGSGVGPAAATAPAAPSVAGSAPAAVAEHAVDLLEAEDEAAHAAVIGGGAAPALTGHETVRVDARALAGILDASENLVLEMSRGVERGTQRTIESTTSELLRELDHVRRLAAAFEATSRSHAAGDLRRRLDRAFGNARTLAAAGESLAASEAVAWSGASSRAKSVAASARGLRQERFEGIAASARQAARDAASDADLEVEVVSGGDDVRFDRRLREPLREILLHLVRNAVAHAFEPSAERTASGKPAAGRLVIRAEEGDGELRMIVRDDGRGIDLAAIAERARVLGIEGAPIDVLFAPGFTTKSDADELAGRGVGLDVVRQRVADLHGRITVDTTRGRGTTFHIAVAPDLSLTRALVARAGAFTVAIRLSAIDRIVRTPKSEVRVASGRSHVLHEGMLVPLASVSSELGAGAGGLPPGDAVTSVVTAAGERRVALIVDELLDEREIAVRPLQGRFRSVPFVSGTTILGDGRLGWVLDARSLAVSARGVAPTEEGEAVRVRRVLVVDDSATTRELERALLRAAGFDVEAVADGEQAWSALSGDATFDVVLTDVEMPRLDGFSLLGRIRATPRLANLPVVLVTALEEPADKQRALDMGASAYIVKSAFDEDRLLDVIADLI